MARFQVNYNNLVSDLNVIYRHLSEPVIDCHITNFLEIGKKRARSLTIIEDDGCRKQTAVSNLSVYHQQSTNITCKECVKIGDAVIALEQTTSFVLVHVDKSFSDFCEKLDQKHLKLESARHFDKDLYEKLHPKSGAISRDTGDDAPLSDDTAPTNLPSPS